MALDNVRALVFDVDGTLYSQSKLRARLLFELTTTLASRPIALYRTLKVLQTYRKAHESTRGVDEALPAHERQLATTLRLCRESDDFVRSTIHEWFERRPLRHLKGCLYPGAAQFFQAARDHGTRLGVMSDYPAADKLKAMGLEHAFDAVMSSHDAGVGVLKPHPRGLQACLERLSVNPEQAVYIGDRLDTDLPCSAAAHTKFVLFGNPPPAPSCLAVSTYQGLSALLGWTPQA